MFPLEIEPYRISIKRSFFYHQNMKRGGESLGKHDNYLVTMYFNESDSFSLIQIDPGFRIFLKIGFQSIQIRGLN